MSGRTSRYVRDVLNPEIEVDDRPVSQLGRAAFLDPLAEAIQPSIRAARDANPAIKSILAGTPIGHSLHIMLTDIPIGSFTALAVLDIAELLGNAGVATGADITLGVGIAGSYGAVVTGWADWSDTHEAPRRVGLAHALVNGTALIAYQASLFLRRTQRRPAGIALAFAAYAVLTLGAYLGGELSSGMLLGARHTGEPLAPPDDFVDVASLADVETNGMLRVDAGGIPMLLSSSDGAIRAVGAICTHRGGPLDEGEREDDCIRCPWHGAVFSLADGTVSEGPATFDLPRFAVRVEGGRVAVRARG